ncbi:MAG: prepilin peptidase [Bacteroidales bacterium]|nr:prepilin peptidase [Bacteroidales bacterium]
MMKTLMEKMFDFSKTMCYDDIVNRSQTPNNVTKSSPADTDSGRRTGGTTMSEMLYGGAIGVIAGLAMNRIAVFQVKRRTTESAKREAIDNIVLAVIWALISGILFAVIFKLYGTTAKRLEYLAYISIVLAIGVVDLDIQKIPNLSVLALLVVRSAAVVYELVTGVSVKGALFPSAIGLVAAFILYQLPMFLHIPIGTGDVKFASAIGYCLGIFGFLQSAIIMAIGLVFFLVYLLTRKKGNLKTKVPMGPFLALGSVATIIYPVFTGLEQQVFPTL